MIKVIDDLYVDVDENNYTAKKDKHTTTTDKNGNVRENYDVIGYYSTLKGALKGIREYCIRKSLSNGDMSLESAINTINDVNDTFVEIIDEVLKSR